VLVGAMPWLIRQVYLELDILPKVTCITCTSFLALPKVSMEVCDKSVRRSFHFMLSWSVNDLLAARDKGAVTFQVDFDEIYYYAGGSIRYIQQFVEEVKSDIISNVNECQDLGRIVGAGCVWDNSWEAANSLMAFYGDNSVIISKFAVNLMVSKASDEFISKARRTSPCNSVWQGWVTELEMLYLASQRATGCNISL